MVAVPKGRVLAGLAARMAHAGVDPEVLLADDRRLVRDDPTTGVRFLLLKPDDVPTYVEYGAADLGIVGRDVLLERNYDVYAPLDLGIGRCRMVVAGLPDARPEPGPGRSLRVATKFANIATKHFESKGQPIEIIYVQSSVELAPPTGLADIIVDLVESGETLRQNGLVEFETIAEVSSVVIANRVGFKLKQAAVRPLIASLGQAPSA
ncbi:MAG: ATP phosphoribosyltransferase [Polyangiales bacterium]